MPENKKTKGGFVTTAKKDYERDWDIHRHYISTFDAYEAMLLGKVYDSTSNSVDGSKITDSYTATLAIERAARVMGKLPDGTTEAAAKGDAGKGVFMDILRQKWIYPSANAQRPFRIKLMLWQLYSSVYGYMPMFYDWNVASSGHVGPDCWLWNPRNLIPQEGKVSIEDMDYVTAVTRHSKESLESMVEKDTDKKDGWDRKAIQELVSRKGDDSAEADSEEETFTKQDRTPSAKEKGIKLATRYESGEDGEWVTFAPDHGFIEVRRIKNPHKNGKIPFVIKYSQPLGDSFYGLGDFQRAKPLQFARDGLTNFYFQGIKMNLVPPIIVNANGVVKHTIDYRAGGVMQETIPGAIRRLETSTAGLSTYQAAQSNLTGSLLSLFGSQNASIPGSESLNPSQGKTPAAINMFNQKEATRDGQERMLLEQAIEELTDGFFSLVANIGTEAVPINLFAEDIREIHKRGLEDVVGLLENFKPDSSGSSGKLTVKPSAWKDIEFRFHITAGSTAEVNQQEQLAHAKDMMDTLAKYQNILKEDPRVEIHWDKLVKIYQALGDVPGAEDIITIKEGPSPQELELMEQMQQMQQQAQQMQQQYEAALQQQAQQAALAPQMVGNQQFSDPELAGLAGEFV